MDGKDGLKRPITAFNSPTFNLDMTIHVDRPVGSMSISPCGRDVALGSRQGLHIIDLDDPYSPPRHLSHHTPWEVADVQWSPLPARDYRIISTSNQKALVWNVAMPSDRSAVEFVLHGHTRAITDINFSAHDPDILATCAVDSFVHCWDLRTPRRPVATFCDWFAGATQVKWNRQDSHIIASSHDRWLRIWDNRKGAVPIRSIEAHGTKIYGVDWNRTRPTAVVTCSLDKTIKFWDYQNQEDTPERVIRTPFPVWRARHTPFGSGICAMPQRGNNDLHLYDRQADEPSGDAPEPVHRFEGHQDQVKEFLWRPRGNIADGVDNREFQLVSWSTDKDLRLHRVSDKVLGKVGFVKGQPVLAKYNFTRNDASYHSYHDESVSELSREFGNRNFSGSSNEKLGGAVRGMLSININRSTGPWAQSPSGKVTMTSRIGMNARSTARRDVNLIEWMKGVRIGKVKANGPLGRQGNVHDPQAYLPQNFLNGTAWDGPENLTDEITAVGDKYKKVTLEKFDSTKRTAVLSMNGPWGKAERPVHVKVGITFPEDYPESSYPTFSVEKTSSISKGAYEMISGGVQLIARGYVTKKRGCLEPVVCFLLGERNLEDSTLLTDGEEAPSDSSSEEGDRIASDLASLPADDELDAAGEDLFPSVNVNANVPLPKGCGAMFAEDGRLVCFFPPKEEEPRSVVDGINIKDNERSARSLRLFEGFGRIHPASPESRPKISSIEEEDIERLDDSDDCWTDSSGSSSTNDVSAFAQGLPRLPWGQSVFDRKKKQGPLSIDNSQLSGNTGSLVKGSQSKPKSIVSIRPVEKTIQPCRKELAEKYLIRGNGIAVCDYNAKVAADLEDENLEMTWKLLKLILCDEVPLRLEEVQSSTSVLVIARKATRPRRRDSGIDVTFDKDETREASPLKGRVSWGFHPFGSSWLVSQIFEHYERAGDIQMLAMLTCVLSQPPSTNLAGRLPRSLSKPKVGGEPLPQTNYYPSASFVTALRQSSLHIPPTPSVQQVSTPQSYTSSSPSNQPALWRTSDPSHPHAHSAGTTPPTARLSPTYYPFHSGGGSISTSPEQLHSQVLRSNANATTAHSPSSSLPRSLPSQSASMSNSLARKRPSPVEAVLTNLAASGVTWGANTIFGSTAPTTAPPTSVSAAPARSVPSRRWRGLAQSTTTPAPLPPPTDPNPDLAATFSGGSSDSDMGGDSHNRPSHHNRHPKKPANLLKDSLPPKPFTLKRKNAHLFDAESHITSPLLLPQNAAVYAGYRRAYAELLSVWGLRIQRTELLKFDVPGRQHPLGAGQESDGSTVAAAVALALAGMDPAKALLGARRTGGDGGVGEMVTEGKKGADALRLVVACSRCEKAVAAEERICGGCGAKLGGLACVWCRRVVRGLVSVRECGVVSCRECEAVMAKEGLGCPFNLREEVEVSGEGRHERVGGGLSG